MKDIRLILVLFLMLPSAGLLSAPLGTAFTYQGRLTEGGNPANGIYHFMFELFDAPVGGTLLNDNEREDLTVSNGLFTVVLDFGPTAFTGNARWLQTKMQTNNGPGFSILTARQQILPTPYALMSANVPDGSITSNKLAMSSVTSASLSRNLTLGVPDGGGSLDIYGDTDFKTIRLTGDPGIISLYGSFDGLENVRLHGGVGELLLFDTLTNDLTVRLSSGSSLQGDLGGLLELFSSSSGLVPSRRQVNLNSGLSGGLLELYNRPGNRTFLVDGGVGDMVVGQNTGPFVRLGAGGGLGIASLLLHGPDGIQRVDVRADAVGEMRLFNQTGINPLTLRAGAQPDGNSGGSLFLRQPNGVDAVRLYANGSGGLNPGGLMRMFQGNGLDSISLVGNACQISIINTNGRESARLFGPTQGEVVLRDGTPANNNGVRLHSQPSFSGLELRHGGVLKAHLIADPNSGGLAIYNPAGAVSILLNGINGQTTTKVLQITGGSDLSEQFEIGSDDDEPKPGMVVCIDPEHPGRLKVSTKAYDRTVAGIVSGAGGVSPGMLMGQQGTLADGKHPVALTGRVYCLADAERGAIQPGDLLTTSETDGHAMKVTEHGRAQGATLGKAMTRLPSGTGLVLVLVSLQ